MPRSGVRNRANKGIDFPLYHTFAALPTSRDRIKGLFLTDAIVPSFCRFVNTGVFGFRAVRRLFIKVRTHTAPPFHPPGQSSVPSARRLHASPLPRRGLRFQLRKGNPLAARARHRRHKQERTKRGKHLFHCTSSHVVIFGTANVASSPVVMIFISPVCASSGICANSYASHRFSSKCSWKLSTILCFPFGT